MAAPALPSLDQLETAAALVRTVVPPTPQYCWPLLSRRIGAELWVKHENHTPIGAFKLRGGLVYLDELRRAAARHRRRSSAPRPAITARASPMPRPGSASPRRSSCHTATARRKTARCGVSAPPRRARARFPGGLRIRGGARRGRQAAHAALVRSAAGARGRELRSRTVSRRRAVRRGAARHGLCADRARQRHLRRDRGARGAGGDRRDRRRRRRECPDLCAVLCRRARGADQFRRYDGRRAGGARAGRRGARDHPEARGAHRHGIGGRDAVGDARSSSPTRTMSPRAPAPPPSPPRSRSAAGSPASGSRSCCRAAISTARCSPRFWRKPTPRWNRRPRETLSSWAWNSAYKLLTVEEFLDTCPNDERHYQLIDGVIVAMAPPAIPHQIIAGNLTGEIYAAVRANRPNCTDAQPSRHRAARAARPQPFRDRHHRNLRAGRLSRDRGRTAADRRNPVALDRARRPFRQAAAVPGDPEPARNPLCRERARRRHRVPAAGGRLGRDRDRRPGSAPAACDDRARHPARRDLSRRARPVARANRRSGRRLRARLRDIPAATASPIM